MTLLIDAQSGWVQGLGFGGCRVEGVSLRVAEMLFWSEMIERRDEADCRNLQLDA